MEQVAPTRSSANCTRKPTSSFLSLPHAPHISRVASPQPTTSNSTSISPPLHLISRPTHRYFSSHHHGYGARSCRTCRTQTSRRQLALRHTDACCSHPPIVYVASSLTMTCHAPIQTYSLFNLLYRVCLCVARLALRNHPRARAWVFGGLIAAFLTHGAWLITRSNAH